MPMVPATLMAKRYEPRNRTFVRACNSGMPAHVLHIILSIGSKLRLHQRHTFAFTSTRMLYMAQTTHFPVLAPYTGKRIMTRLARAVFVSEGSQRWAQGTAQNTHIAGRFIVQVHSGNALRTRRSLVVAQRSPMWQCWHEVIFPERPYHEVDVVASLTNYVAKTNMTCKSLRIWAHCRL